MSSEIYWFPFEWNRWLSNEKLSMSSLEARGLWIHLICLMYKSNCDGKLLIDGIKPSVSQIARMVGSTEEKIAPILKELEQIRILEIDSETGAYFHASVKIGLQKMNSRKDAYSKRFKKKHDDRLLIDTPSIRHTCTHNNNNSNNNSIDKAKPTREQWIAYGKEIGWSERDSENAFDYYESNGWKVGGRAPVKNWKACARYCFRRGNTNQKGHTQMKPKPQPKSSCESAPLYRVMGFASFQEWQKAGSPS